MRLTVLNLTAGILTGIYLQIKLINWKLPIPIVNCLQKSDLNTKPVNIGPAGSRAASIFCSVSGTSITSYGEGGLADIIPTVLIQGLIGYPYTCPDMIGGGEIDSFSEEDSDFSEELYVRWMQCSVFFPMIQFSILPNNALNPENLRLVMDLVKFRQQTIIPVLKELLKKAAKTGEPIIRHMAYEFPGEGLEKVMDQYMFGSDYLVAPVLEEGANSRKVIFPKGTWLADDGTKYKGGQTYNIEALLNRLPYFKKL